MATWERSSLIKLRDGGRCGREKERARARARGWGTNALPTPTHSGVALQGVQQFSFEFTKSLCRYKCEGYRIEHIYLSVN